MITNWDSPDLDSEDLESGLVFWNWETQDFSFWPGDYIPLGWNDLLNGFAVIDISQPNIYRVEVLKVN